MTKEMLYSAGARFLEATKTWEKFKDKMYDAGLDIDEHWVNEVYYLFEDQVWDTIVDYRNYPTICDGEQAFFEEMLYDLATDRSDFTLEEIINCFLDPGVVVDIFDLGK